MRNEHFELVKKALDNIDFSSIFSLGRLIRDAKRVYVIGNGGSIAMSSHVAEDLLKNANIKIYALSDISLLTMEANDFGFDKCFLNPLKTYIEEDDLILALSGSGNSKNLIKAFKELKCKKAAILGNKGGKLIKYCDKCILIPSKEYEVIEDCISAVCHTIVKLLKEK